MSETADLRDRQREEWNRTAPGWKKWDPFLMEWLRPVGERVLTMARMRDGDVVLDVATGSGEPGLTAAGRVGKGRVVGLDISEGMVSVAREKARSRGIQNYETRVYSSPEIPFESNRFDAVFSRFGVMFFPDVLEGLKQMARVLKPARTMGVAVFVRRTKE